MSDNGFKNNNMVHFIEPNYTNSIINTDENNKSTVTEFTNDYEDYCIAVDLEVEIKNRTIGASRDENNKVLVLSWSGKGDGKNISFLQGTRINFSGSDESKGGVNYLTTDYADMYYDDIRDGKNTSEMFGISSIDISYNNYFMPQVTIQFVDIRGLSLFSPEELRHSNTYENIGGFSKNDIAGSFFKCFFTFPYPKFYLKVKGFYGEPVAYELTCSDFRCTFDSSTGNFGATAQFLGYSFSLLNDITVNCLIAAPYSDYCGKSYWESKLGSTFTVLDKVGNETKMPTLVQIMQYYKNAEAEAEKISKDDPLKQRQDELNNKNNVITSLITAYNNFFNDLFKYCNDNSSNVGNDSLCFRGKDNKQIMVILPDGGYSGFTSDISNNRTITDKYNDLIKIKANNVVSSLTLKDYKNQPIKILNNTNGVLTINESLYNVINKDNIIIKNLNDLLNKNGKNLSGYTYAYIYDNSDFVTKLSEMRDSLSSDISKNGVEIAEREIEMLADSLGFVPSVKNFVKILMAHLETLMYMIDTAAKATTTLNRSLSSMGMSDGSDFNENMQVPPFPKVVKKEKNNKGNITNISDEWIGKLSANAPEADVVHGLLNGIKRTQPIMDAYASRNNGNADGETLANKTYVPIPLSTLDMLTTSNPFGRSINFDDISDFIGKVCLRMLTVLDLNAFSNNSQWNNKASLIGEADAVNFAKLFTNPSNNFLKRLMDSNNLIDANFMLNILTNDSSVDSEKGDDKCWAWDNTKTNPNSVGLLVKDNNTLFLNMYRVLNQSGDTVINQLIPIEGMTFNDTSNDLTMDKNNYCELPVNNIGRYVTISDNTKDENKFIESNGNIVYISDDIDKFVSYKNQIKLDDGNRLDVIKNFFDIGYNHEKYINYIYQDSYNIGKKFAANSNGVGLNFSSFDGNRLLSEVKRNRDTIVSDMNSNFNVFGTLSSVNGMYPTFNKCSVVTVDSHGNPNGVTDKIRGINGFGIGKSLLENLNNITDYTIPTFVGFSCYENELRRTNSASIFGQYCYYLQNDDKARAFLFLESLRHINLDEVISSLVSDEVAVLTVPKIGLLLCGAYLWRYNAMNVENATDVFVFDEFFTFKKGKDERIRYGQSLNKELFNIRNEIKTSLIKLFTEWVEGEFKSIQSNLELVVNNGTVTHDFIKWFGSNLDGKWDDGTNNKNFLNTIDYFNPNKTISGSGYVNIEDYVSALFGGNLFSNYVSFSRSENSDSKKIYGIKLYNRETSEIINRCTSLILKPSMLIKGIRNNGNVISVGEGAAKSYFNAFLNRLKELYKDIKIDDTTNNTSQAAITDCDENIKITLYKYCKNIYDRWFGGFNFSAWTVDKFFKENFYFIDTYYNKIGDEIIINLKDLCDRLLYSQSQDGYAMLSLIGDVLSKNGFAFYCVQNFADLSDRQKLMDMFKPIPYIEMGDAKKQPDFVCMYSNEPSSHLNIENSEYEDDSFMLNDSLSFPEPIKGKTTENGYSIPAFGVTQGKQYQSYFYKVEVGMESPMVTEQSLKAMYLIAGENDDKAGENGRHTVFLGQDLYTIYSNNSYTCTVTMMGCAWIQPLMYFVLLNIPLFRGSYLIQKVTHHIEPGNMSTTFVGVRMSKFSTRKVNRWLYGKVNDEIGGTIMGTSNERIGYSSASIQNDCDYKVYPVSVIDNNGPRFNIDDLEKLDAKWINFGEYQYDNIYEALVATAFAEAGNQDEIGVKLALTVIINRYMRFGGWRKVFVKNQVAVGVHPYSSVPLNIIAWCNDLIENGLGVLIGETATPDGGKNWEKSVNIYVNNQRTPNMTTPKKITLNDIRKICSYCTTAGYGGLDVSWKVESHLEYWRGAEYFLQHKGHVFTGYDKGAAKPCWDITDVNTTSGTTNISNQAAALLRAIQRTCDSTTNVKVKLSTASNSSGSTMYLKASDDSKMASVFDIILNGYYDYIKELYWVCDSEGTISSFNPSEVKVVVAEPGDLSAAKKSVDVVIKNKGYTVANCPKMFSDLFYRSIYKRYGDINIGNNWNICQSEVKSFSGTSNDVIMNRMNDNKPTSCSV